MQGFDRFLARVEQLKAILRTQSPGLTEAALTAQATAQAQAERAQPLKD